MQTWSIGIQRWMNDDEWLWLSVDSWGEVWSVFSEICLKVQINPVKRSIRKLTQLGIKIVLLHERWQCFSLSVVKLIIILMFNHNHTFQRTINSFFIALSFSLKHHEHKMFSKYFCESSGLSLCCNVTVNMMTSQKNGRDILRIDQLHWWCLNKNKIISGSDFTLLWIGQWWLTIKVIKSFTISAFQLAYKNYF